MTLRDDILSLLAEGPQSQDGIVRRTRGEDVEMYTHCRLVTRALEQMASDGAIVSEDRGGLTYWRLAASKGRTVSAGTLAGGALVMCGGAVSPLTHWGLWFALAGLLVMGATIWRTK